jgi:hypothetical protein
MYIYICVYVHMYMYTYIRIHLYTYTHMYMNQRRLPIRHHASIPGYSRAVLGMRGKLLKCLCLPEVDSTVIRPHSVYDHSRSRKH